MNSDAEWLNKQSMADAVSCDMPQDQGLQRAHQEGEAGGCMLGLLRGPLSGAALPTAAAACAPHTPAALPS